MIYPSSASGPTLGRGLEEPDGALRVIPALFVGRRRLVTSREAWRGGRAQFLCGACRAVVARNADRAQLADVVIRCDCGAHNQL